MRRATASEHNKRLVRRALEEIYANGDLEVAGELIHPDFVDHEPAHPEQPTGPEGVGQTVRQLHETFGGLRFEVQDEIAEGDKVVQLVVADATPDRSLGGSRRAGSSPSGTSTSGGSPEDRSSSTGEAGMTSASWDSSGFSRCSPRAGYERLLGSEPAFFPHATEAVWEQRDRIRRRAG